MGARVSAVEVVLGLEPFLFRAPTREEESHEEGNKDQ